MPSPSISNSQRRWNILNVLKWAESYFRKYGIDDSRIDAEVLLAHALNSSRIDLYLHHDKPLSSKELSRFKELIKKRAAREPVAYILGQKEFWSRCFSVSKEVLIPRPETECVVEIGLKLIKKHTASFPLKIIELGTGSGAIIVSLASEIPGHCYIASDNSLAAVKIARQNATNLLSAGAILWWVGDWLNPVKPEEGLFDFIFSNPPYIQKKIIEDLQPEVSRYEPFSALNGGMDGLESFRQIIPESSKRLRSGGYLILEIGFDQKEAVAGIARDCNCFESIHFQKDYSGHDRIAVFRLR